MSERVRQIKDPIYGYIYLPDDYVQGVVDTPEFQRLRKISQTSYEALYPSATHNRFAHSLGVFHLGSIVAQAIRENSIDAFGLNDEQKDKYLSYLEVYRLACLLHDVGHAPFSHTSERFYIDKTGRRPLHEAIETLTGDGRFVAEAKNAAPHELMSAVVALKHFGVLIGNNQHKSFFARAITGYEYAVKDELKSNEEGVSYAYLNALISLLNSKVVDVDRLDYLIRDAFQTGYESINIDYERLLKAVRIKKHDGSYELVFSKDALSVLENAVYAHDAEKKWIQTHLAICYDTYLLENAISKLLVCDELSSVELFGEKGISTEGVEIPLYSDQAVGRDYRIRLMSDGDVLFLLKNNESDFSLEYFDRRKRKHPLWKTEHEYKSHFKEEGWTEFFKSVAKYDGVSAPGRIDSVALERCQRNVVDCEQACKDASSQEQEKCSDQLTLAQKMLKRLEMFKSFADEVHIAFDFVLLQRKPFESGFNKKEFSSLKIEVRGTERAMRFCDATDVLSCGVGSEKPISDETYYLFMQKPAELAVSVIEKFKSMFRDLI